MLKQKPKNPLDKEKIILMVAGAILAVLFVLAGSNFSNKQLLSSTLGEDGGWIAKNTVTSNTGKAFTGEAPQAGWIFTDIPATHPNADALQYLKDNGIMKGYSDGSFGPDKLINRAEIIKTIILALGEPKDIGNYKNCFTDVKEEWFAPYACYAKWKGWVKGYGDGGYHPSSNVTRAEALKMMIEAYGLTLVTAPPEGSAFAGLDTALWYAPYVWTAEKYDIMSAWSGVTADGLNSTATRLEVATAIYALEKLEGVGGATDGSGAPTI